MGSQETGCESTAGMETTSGSGISKEDIESLILNKSTRVTLIDKNQDGRAKSAVWKNFKFVCVDGQSAGFVLCNDCGVVVPWKLFNTSSMQRHHCKRKTTGIQLKLDQFSTKVIPPSVISELNKKVAIGLAKDLRPLNAVEGTGFKMIAQELVSFGARFGFQKVSNFLHSARTVKRTLPEIVNEKRSEIKRKLLLSPTYPKFSFTTDLWSDCYQQRNFLSLSIHYLTQSYDLETHMVAVEEFPDMPKTSINIRQECARMIAYYFEESTDEILQESYFVTDGGSNLINAFQNRLPCLCHRLNLLITWMFYERNDNKSCAANSSLTSKRQFKFSSECPQFSAALASVKSVVSYFKRAGLNKKLTTTLKQEVSTRWNSQLTMLESYVKVKEEVKKILLEKNRLEMILAIDEKSVDELIAFLRYFQNCSQTWSKEKLPTIHEVVLWIHQMKNHIAAKEGDSCELLALKVQAMMCFDEYFKVDDLYYVACILNPKTKGLKFVDKEIRNRVYESTKELIDQVVTNHPQPSPRPQNSQDEALDLSTMVPETKRARFEELLDSSDSDNETLPVKHELDRYLECKIKKGHDVEILKYWSTTNEFPALKRIASWILAIPASQTSDERVFSTTGSTLTPRRSSLIGSTLSDLTYIHKNFTC